MTTSEMLIGGLIVVLTLLSVAISVLRLGQANPLQQLLGLAAVVGMVVLVVTVALIFHNVQSKLGPTNAPNVSFPTQSAIPLFSGEFATPSIPPLVR